MNETMTRPGAREAQPYVDRIKATLLRYEMFTGAYDRLWKMLECHEIDVREPGDGTFIPAAKWREIEEWLDRAIARFYAKPASPAPASPKPGRVNFTDVAPGYYATVSPRPDQDYDFWYVTAGTRNPSYRFVKRYLGGQGPIRITGAEAIRALRTILAEGVDVTGDRFADELGRCRDCGLPLTDETSRELRRGPVCRSK